LVFSFLPSGPIYHCGGATGKVKRELHGQIGKLGAKYAASKDETVKAELDRLTAELAKLPERWEFISRG
jgi:hypothetical protein